MVDNSWDLSWVSVVGKTDLDFKYEYLRNAPNLWCMASHSPTTHMTRVYLQWFKDSRFHISSDLVSVTKVMHTAPLCVILSILFSPNKVRRKPLIDICHFYVFVWPSQVFAHPIRKAAWRQRGKDMLSQKRKPTDLILCDLTSASHIKTCWHPDKSE